MFGALDNHVCSYSDDEVFGTVYHQVALASFSRTLVSMLEDHGSMPATASDAASTLAVRMQPEGAPPMRSLPQATPGAVEPVVQIPYQELRDLTPSAVEKLHKAFVGERAYGAVAITGIPNYAELKHDAFRAGVDLALLDDEGRKRSAAVNNTYPGWSGTPGSETHPLQNSFLFNVKEELGGQMDPFFGKNIFPSEDYRKTWVKFVDVMYANALQVLRGCDKVLDTEIQQWQAQRSLERLGDDGPALAGRFICYDSGFTREDKLLELRDGVSPLNSNASSIAELPQSSHGHEEPSEMSVKTVGHAGDGLASMRTHATPVKTAGHAGDGLASMRTHATPVKTAGHAGDGLASMRTHATPVKTAGHAGDGMATMQTPSAPVKTSSSGYNPLELSSSLAGSLSSQGSDDAVPVSQPETDYWLPWHVDSNFVTILHKEMYASESTGEFISEPPGSGLMFMNEVGETTMLDCSDPNTMLLQMGAFAQIYTGGKLKACRHAVLNPVKPGVARFNYCNFWYVPWDTLCTAPEGMEATAVNQGWNAMMDESYLNITMKQSFTAFRQFMVSPEARVQFSDSQRFKELSAILPIVRKQGDAGAPTMPNIQVDLLTDVRCPFSFISQMNLQNAIQNLGLQDNVVVRYHPVFLNPNVPKEGESLDDYLWREFGYTKEYAHSEDYPLRRYGREAGVEMNPHRRVVNTFDAFCLIEAAQEEGVQHELVQTLSRWYFEEAKDISDVAVLRAAALHVGLDAERALQRSSELQGTVQERYEEFSAMLGEVPHFLLREQASGNGLELGGLRSVEAWEQVLQQVMERGQFMGMTIDGPHGQKVRVDRANPFTPVSHALPAQHGWTPTAWPYQEEDFSRMDERPDDLMYSEPRLAEHLDLSSLQTLTETYEAIFQACPDGFSVLDLCSSWNSHYPNMDRASKVAVHGLNAVELEMNEVATERHIQDLNLDQKLPWADNSFDVATLALSIQYLTKPREVFAELQRVLKPGGMAVVAFSHRSFIEKAVRLWASEPDDGEGHAHVVCRYFQHGPENGWEKIKTMDVSPRHGDPVWIVTAVKPM
ncbi:unnamed protein product [Durusdinium trenchii]|uniref:Methyltransferase type 11 domain-containing protein n=1 Tax=Durusdinium trenchii TaxID=1381693 RepID=A0ABP0Q6B1_9DINO